MGHFSKLWSSFMLAMAPLTLWAQLAGFNFDIDGNLLFLPTKIVFWDALLNMEVGMDAEEFAKAAPFIGKQGKYESLRYIEGNTSGTFRQFMDGKKPYFLKDIKFMLKQSPEIWKGPCFAALQFALSTPEFIPWTTFITARGHFKKTIHQGFERIVKAGHLPRSPMKRNIHPVGNPAYRGMPQTRAAEKANVMFRYLDKMNKESFHAKGIHSWNREGNQKALTHLQGFSDDDHHNYKTMAALLGKEVAKNRWPNVKITLFYSGDKHNIVAEVIKSDGTLRPRMEEEKGEAKRIAEFWNQIRAKK